MHKYSSSSLMILLCALCASSWAGHPEVVSFESPEMPMYYAGYVRVLRKNPKLALSGHFVVIKKGEDTLYQRFEPDSSSPSNDLVLDEVIQTDELYTRICARDRGVSSTVAFVQPKRKGLRLIKSNFDDHADYQFNSYDVLKSITTTEAITKLSDCHYQSHRVAVPEKKYPERSVEFWTDEHGRINHAFLKFKYDKGWDPPDFEYNITYYDKISTVPLSIEKVHLYKSPYDDTRRTDYVRYDEVREYVTSEPVKPTLLQRGSEVQDFRFSPPLIYKSTGTEFPLDEELFALAEKRKAENDVNARLIAESKTKAAIENDPHNMKDVPVTGESWGKRLRRIPNWAYGGAVVLFLGGWIAAASRRRRK